MNSMTNDKDATIQELHRIRREIAEKFRGDLHAINADARARIEKSGQMIAHKEQVQSGEVKPKAS